MSLGLMLPQSASADIIENFIEDSVEELAYISLRASIIASGKSSEYADCFLKMLKMQGIRNTVLDPKNYFGSKSIGDIIEEKFQLADFVCSNVAVTVLLALLSALLVFCVCSVCCRCLCWPCCSKKPDQIHLVLASNAKNFRGRRNREDKVEMSQGLPPYCA